MLCLQNQQQLDAEKAKHKALEAEHRETARRMKNLTSGSDEQKAAMVDYRGEQEELENQRKLLDDLEFLMLEARVLTVEPFSGWPDNGWLDKIMSWSMI